MVLAENLNPGTVKKWTKFIECHWEYDWYQRKPIHTDTYSTSCSVCQKFVDAMEVRSIQWIRIEEQKFIKMKFKKSVGDSTFHCSIFSIRTYGLLEVELTAESAYTNMHIRRDF